jgi:hypothetical protein
VEKGRQVPQSPLLDAKATAETVVAAGRKILS